VIEASELRLRPILMTTGAMVLGTIPLALARGAGAESRQQIGWVIVGGLLLGTFFTLFVVPTVYTCWRGGRRRWQEEAKCSSTPDERPSPTLPVRLGAGSGLYCTPEERGWNHCRQTNSRTIISSPMTSGRRHVHHA
jgi:hypothetical protein